MQVKGFTLVESLFVLAILLTMALFITNYHFQGDHAYFNEINTIYLCQSEAMKTKQKQDLSQYMDYANASITFNAYGNINHGLTLKYKKQNYVFQLGMGRFYVAS